MSMVHNMVSGGQMSKCILTVKNCGAGATVTALSSSSLLTATADVNGDAVFTLTKKDIYTISSTISKGTTEFLFYAKTEAEIWLHTLPNEYQEVEFLQSSGSQYIKTGIIQSTYATTLKIIADAQYNSTPSAEAYICGVGISSQSFLQLGNFTSWFGAHYGGVAQEFQIASKDTNRHIWTINKPDGVASIDNVTKAFSTSVSQNLEIYLFAENRANSAANYSSIKLYNFKLYDNNIVLRDFAPCYRISDSVAGMYDMVNDIFYTNAGSGTFIVGQDILYPDDFQEVEYLQSTGTQYINLPYIFNTTDIIELKAILGVTGDDKFLVTTATWNNPSNTRIAIGGGRSSRRGVGFGGAGTDTTLYNPSISPNTSSIFIEKYENNNFILSTDNQNYTFTSTGSFETSTSLKLFYGYNANTAGRIYYFKHSKINGNSINLISCFRKRDKKPGMWDSVSHKFFINSGTGEFILGRMII